MNKSESGLILLKLKNKLQQTLPPNPILILGVSGGADSMALLYAMHKLDVNGLVVHINYGLRGAESDADQELVEQFASMLGFECCTIRPDTKPEGLNFQEWARVERYTVFEELRTVYNADGIAVGHHHDDQLETLLFKVLRGSGLPKLTGIESWDTERKIFRPFLEFSKQSLLEFCEAKHIPFRTDETNNESNYARNAIRNEVFPVFEKFIPGWRENLIRITEQATAYQQSIEGLLGKVTSGNSLLIGELSMFSASLKGALLKVFVESNTATTLSKGQIEQLVLLMEAETGGRINIDSSLSVIRDREVLYLETVTENKQGLHTFIIQKNEIETGIAMGDWKFIVKPSLIKEGLYVDADSIAWPVTCRKWQPGDSFRPLGMSGSQKVSDHLTNRKIKSAHRQDSLILCDSDGTIIAILYPEPLLNGQIGNISETAKETELTTRYFCIEKL